MMILPVMLDRALQMLKPLMKGLLILGASFAGTYQGLIWLEGPDTITLVFGVLLLAGIAGGWMALGFAYSREGVNHDNES